MYIYLLFLVLVYIYGQVRQNAPLRTLWDTRWS